MCPSRKQWGSRVAFKFPVIIPFNERKMNKSTIICGRQLPLSQRVRRGNIDSRQSNTQHTMSISSTLQRQIHLYYAFPPRFFFTSEYFCQFLFHLYLFRQICCCKSALDKVLLRHSLILSETSSFDAASDVEHHYWILQFDFIYAEGEVLLISNWMSRVTRGGRALYYTRWHVLQR